MRMALSINNRLTIFIGILLLAILGLGAGAIVGLHVIDSESEILERETLVATQLLGEMGNHVSEFRVAEEYRALAQDPAAIAIAEGFAADHRGAVKEIEARYDALETPKSDGADLSGFRNSWNAYLSEHDVWVKNDVAGALDDPARYLSSLHTLYVAANREVAAAIAANTLHGNRQAAAVDSLVHGTIALIVCLGTGGVLVTLLLLFLIRRDITMPLAAITTALEELAKGRRDTLVPSRNRHDEIGKMVDAFEVFRANTFALEQAHEAARLAQEHAQALARHDPLTGLPNRRLFEIEIDQAVSRAVSGRNLCSLLMIDLDRFKPVNDQLGHPVGDLVLCEIASRLKALKGESDTVARLGGDEFAMILVGSHEEHGEKLHRMTEAVLKAMNAPIHVTDNPLQIGATIGIASCPTNGSDAETLLRAADLALYRAKREGRGRIRFFETEMETELQARASVEADLRAAIRASEIRPRYQPLVSMREGTIHGFEVTPHWIHPSRGMMEPDVYCELAGQLGLLTDLMWPMLRQACRDAREWAPHMVLAINFTATQLRDPAMPTQLLSLLNQENFPPSRLEIEIAERALVTDLEQIKFTLVALQTAGIRISLDDFGTGYSSLFGQRELRFHRVKIDRSFMHLPQSEDRTEGIVGTVISMARNLAGSTAADGIDGEESARMLSSLGCELGQGPLFGQATGRTGAKRLLARASGAPSIHTA